MRADHKIKLLLILFFRQFLDLFYPNFSRQIDWSKPLEFLDKELQSVVVGASMRVVDLLVRVHLLGGGTRCCLIHVEVEGRKSRTALAKRLHRYFLRLDERFDLPIMPIAIFLNVGGEGLGWASREMTCFGHTVDKFEFPYVGLPALDGCQYASTDNPLAWALAGLMNVPPSERARIKAESLRRVERQRLEAKHKTVLVQCVEAFTVLDAEQKREFESLLKLTSIERQERCKRRSTTKRKSAGKDVG